MLPIINSANDHTAVAKDNEGLGEYLLLLSARKTYWVAGGNTVQCVLQRSAKPTFNIFHYFSI